MTQANGSKSQNLAVYLGGGKCCLSPGQKFERMQSGWRGEGLSMSHRSGAKGQREKLGSDDIV